ncbi:MAG: PfkB family carbohydrate kinase [Candidatus Marinimicrobia bacterium]|nr:PfkB family carbohydrate kinase [Candidatus Neomarinimicrobiota bacterium]MDD5581812.1 PfkB family carbohydrate kinase [Candidatus Neomarinimicrobiota bacterium]
MKLPKTLFNHCVFATGLLVYDHVLFLDSYPALNEKRVTSDVYRFFGGPASNATAFLSRSGVETYLLAACGDDDVGMKVLEEIKEQGVNTTYLQVKEGTQNPVAYILIEKANHGKRTAILADDKNCIPVYDAHFVNAMKAGDILLVEGRYEETEFPICKEAHKKGVLTVLDPGSRVLNLEKWSPVIDFWLAPKEGVIKTLGTIDLFSACQFLSKPSVKLAAVTLGAGGVVYGNRKKTAFQPAFHVQAVDSNGSGDIFHAGFIWGLLNDWEYAACIEFGAAAGALSATFIGTHSPELTAHMVENSSLLKHV